MPSSAAYVIPYVVSIITQLRPDSILDVGVGFGKWGYLFREYTDIERSFGAKPGAAGYSKSQWKARIDGIEAFEDYIHDGHRFIYDEIHIGDAIDVLPRLGVYDVIFLGDVLEHFEMAVGTKLLRTALEHAAQCVIVTTPSFFFDQGDACGNPFERHRSFWKPKDLRSVAPCKIRTVGEGAYVVAYPRPQAKPFRLVVLRYRPYPLWYRSLRAVYRLIRSVYRRMAGRTVPPRREAPLGTAEPGKPMSGKEGSPGPADTGKQRRRHDRT